MLRVLFLSVVVVLAVLAALPAQASALSCAYSNPAAGVHYSNVVFEGVAQPGPTDDRGYLYTPATFKVNRYLKGSGSSQRKVTTGRNSDPEEPSIAGGVDAKPGETWTIYGRVVGGVVEAGYCDPTHRGRATRPTPRPTGLEPGRSIAGAALESASRALSSSSAPIRAAPDRPPGRTGGSGPIVRVASASSSTKTAGSAVSRRAPTATARRRTSGWDRTSIDFASSSPVSSAGR